MPYAAALVNIDLLIVVSPLMRAPAARGTDHDSARFRRFGSLIYFISEYLPEMRYSRGGRKVLRAVGRPVDPNRAMRETETEFERSRRLPTALRWPLPCPQPVATTKPSSITSSASGYAKDVCICAALSPPICCRRWSAARVGYERLFALGMDARQPDDDLVMPLRLRVGDGGADAAFPARRHDRQWARWPLPLCAVSGRIAGRRGEARTLPSGWSDRSPRAGPHTGFAKAWYRTAGRCPESAVRIGGRSHYQRRQSRISAAWKKCQDRRRVARSTHQGTGSPANMAPSPRFAAASGTTTGRHPPCVCDLPLFASDSKFDSGTRLAEAFVPRSIDHVTMHEGQQLHAANRSALRPRCPSRPRFSGRAQTDRVALLHRSGIAVCGDRRR